MGADRVTLGPPFANGLNTFDQKAIILDQTNGTLYSSGSANGRKAMLAMGAPLVLPAQTAQTAITSARQLLGFGFGQGALNVIGRKLRVKGFLIYSTTAANVAQIGIVLAMANTIGLRILTTITTDATNTAASANLPIHFEFELTVVTLGATATLETHGKVDANIGTVAGSSVATYLDTNATVSAPVNLTAPTTLSVYMQANAAIPTAQLRSASVIYEA